ncbi:hypothetical protein ACVH8U_003057 [Yersinia enterocolitica]
MKTVGENISAREAYNQLIKQRYQIVVDFNHWDGASHKGVSSTFYQYDNHDTSTRDYFRLKTSTVQRTILAAESLWRADYGQ